MGVRDPWRNPKFLCGCKRPGKPFRNFCVSVRDPWRNPNFCVDVRGSKCRPKYFVAREMKTHGHGYHPDLELSDRSRE